MSAARSRSATLEAGDERARLWPAGTSPPPQRAISGLNSRGCGRLFAVAIGGGSDSAADRAAAGQGRLEALAAGKAEAGAGEAKEGEVNAGRRRAAGGEIAAALTAVAEAAPGSSERPVM